MSARARPLPSLVTKPTSVASHETPLAGAMQVPTAAVVPDPHQPRTVLGSLEDLQASIAEVGILQPLLVRDAPPGPAGDPRYQLIAGARRHAAALRLGLPMVPVLIRSDTETVRLRTLQLLENLQREDLSPLDEAHAYEELMTLTTGSPEDVARLLHISGQKVRERLRLLEDRVLGEAVARKQISASVAREIGKLPDPVAHQYRARVADGEPLTLNTVAEARTQAREAGVVNPRLKRKARPPADGAELEPAAPTAHADQTVFDPPPTASQQRQEQALAALLGTALRAGLPPGERTVALTGLRALVDAPDAAQQVLALVRDVLSRLERPRV
jgi:ParB/RepB/Spo0J family partition protein